MGCQEHAGGVYERSAGAYSTVKVITYDVRRYMYEAALLAPITDYGLWIIGPAHPGNNPDYFRLRIIDLAHPRNNPDYCRLWIITVAYPTPT